MLDGFLPSSEDDLAAYVSHAVETSRPIEVCGSGTKRAIGRPVQTASKIGMGKLRGITLYEPSELVISARAGTPLSEIEALLDENSQMLAFEPSDLTPLSGSAPDGIRRSAAYLRPTPQARDGCCAALRAITCWAFAP